MLWNEGQRAHRAARFEIRMGGARLGEPIERRPFGLDNAGAEGGEQTIGLRPQLLRLQQRIPDSRKRS